MTDTIPLQLLATEWGVAADTLAAQLGDAIVTDCLRVRHVAIQDACKLLEQLDAEAARQRLEDEQHRAAMAAMQQPVIDRVQAIQAKQHAQRANGEIDADTPALVAMTMGDPNNRLEAAGRRFGDPRPRRHRHPLPQLRIGHLGRRIWVLPCLRIRARPQRPCGA